MLVIVNESEGLMNSKPLESLHGYYQKKLEWDGLCMRQVVKEEHTQKIYYFILD